MTIHDAKEWMNQAYRAEENINSIKKEIDNLWDIAKCITPKYSNEGSVSSYTADKTARSAVKIADKMEEYEDKIKTYLKSINAVNSAIDKIQDADEKLILRKRYLNFEKWEQIAQDMNYSTQRIFQIHKKAMEAVCKIMEIRKTR